MCSCTFTITACRYAVSLPRSASVHKLCAVKFPNILVSRRLSHWIKSYDKFEWSTIPDEEAKKWYEVPNWWKEQRKLSSCRSKGRDSQWAMPTPIQEALEREVAAMSIGTSAVTARAELVSSTAIVKTAKRLIDIYNKEAIAKQDTVSQHNAENMWKVSRGEQPVDTAIANLKPGIRMAKGRPNMMFAMRWKRRMGWQNSAVSTAGV